MVKQVVWLSALFAIVAQLGCSNALAPVKPPRIDSAAAAQGALAALDQDGDARISKSEAATCQGIHEHWERYDQDGDGQVSDEELVARFDQWTAGDTGMMNLRAEVIYKGKPLPDAKVRLTPYEFLGPNVLPAEGVTDRYGFVFLSVPKDLLPPSQQGTHGMQVGLFHISVTHPGYDLAAKYNAQSELSVDLSALEANTGIRISLK